MSDQPISFGRRVSLLARAHPDRPAIRFLPRAGNAPDTAWERMVRTLTWAELERAANRAAHALRRHGVGRHGFVAVGLPNSPEFFVAALGAWKLGACVLPLHPALPAPERTRVFQVAPPAAVVADWVDLEDGLPSSALADPTLSDSPLPDVIPQPGKAILSGGSTGRPKVIVSPDPWAFCPGDTAMDRLEAGMRPDQVQLVAGALYHNTPFMWSMCGLFNAHTLVVMERFDAARAVDLVERLRVNFGALVPTMMRRIAQLPDIERRDFSSVHAFMHSAAPCPPWVKRAWIEILGAQRLYEIFGSTEMVGVVRNRGDEWLTHPGTVGRPHHTRLRILDEQGRDLPPGEVGEIFTRPDPPRGPTYAYLGAPPARVTPNGFTSVGDLGWVDAGGFVYLADRRADLIITGGANVYPAEVEAALTEHTAVLDVAVIGIPDEDRGQRVHAVVQPLDPLAPPSAAALDAHCRARLAPYKVPRSYELVPHLPRDDAGKLRRSALVAERAIEETPADEGSLPSRPLGGVG
jgi:bile acid-coenzyme A ligase